MKNKVSVIVPVYNVSKYIEKCVSSLVTQSYKNIDVILIDDGSIDETSMIADRVALNDDRISVIHKPNKGLSDARNTGIQKADGRYLIFVDGDDYLSQDNAVELAIKKMEIDNSDVVIYDFIKVDEKGKEVENVFIENEEKITSTKALERLLEDKYWRYSIACNKVYKKEIWENLRFPLNRLHEDEFVVHHVFSMCETVSILPIPLLCYVQRDLSIMHQKSEKNVIDIVDALIDRVDFYADVGFQRNAQKTLCSVASILSNNYHSINRPLFLKKKKEVFAVLHIVHHEKMPFAEIVNIIFLLDCARFYQFLKKLYSFVR